jgi:hypothetical protein
VAKSNYSAEGGVFLLGGARVYMHEYDQTELTEQEMND